MISKEDEKLGEVKSEAEGSLWELKHLTYQRKRNQIRDSRSSGERKGISPNHALVRGVVGPRYVTVHHRRTSLERAAIEGESPVCEMMKCTRGILSRVGHVKSGLKLGGPPSKAK